MVAKSNGPAPNLPPSKRAQETLKHVEVLPAPHSVGKAFRSYEPAIDLFPVDLWARVAARVLRSSPPILIRPRRSTFTTKHSHKPAVILGFAGCNPSELRRGISVLATLLQPNSH
jgi:DNA-binding transcriptional MocR family regulator